MGCSTSANKDFVKVSPVSVLPAPNSKHIVSDEDVKDSSESGPGSPAASPTSTPKCLFPKSQTCIKGVRTTLDSALNPHEALMELRKGNKRFRSGEQNTQELSFQVRGSLASDGQSPMAAIIGCADSRVPIEIVFDSQPGDLFVLRNAGNTCMCAEGSMVGSIEYSIGHLRTPLVLVMGHTKCGAVAGATQMACKPCLDPDDLESTASSKQTMLESLLSSLEAPVKEAAQMLPQSASLNEIAALAVKCNVFHTMRSLLKYSDLLREKVDAGQVQVQGAIYDITSGRVEFLGPLPNATVCTM